MSHQIASRPLFPLELVENILEHAYSQYPRLESPLVLYQCALVCRAWRNIAQQLIFSEIILRWDSRTSPLPKNKTLSQIDEGLHGLIRSVWTKALPDVGIIEVLALPGLQEFHFLGRRGMVWGLPRAIPKPLNTGGYEDGLARLTSLSLSEVSIPVKILCLSTSLKELKLDCCRFNSDDGVDTSIPPPNQRTELQSFYLRGDRTKDEDILEWMMMDTFESPFDFTKLKTLQMTYYGHTLFGYELIQSIMEQCASTIQDLMVGPPAECASSNPLLTPEFLLNPSELRNLQTICIPITQGPSTNYVPWLTEFVSSLSEDTPLKEVLIPCIFSEGTLDPETDEPNLDKYGWEDLDAVLLNIPTLKRVVISVEGEDYACQTLAALDPQFRSVFPWLDAKGILEIMDTEEMYHISREVCWWASLGL